MNEVEIPINVSGLGAIKAELRALKGEIANATDPADIQRLSQAAGVLSDRIKDANESVANFSTGSAFESSRNQIDGIGSSLASLDFAEAGQKMQGFAKNLSTMNPSAFTAGLGAMAKGVGALSKQFIKMGMSLLVNPFFLIAAAIVALVVVVALILNKFGILTKVIDIMMIPINLLIKGFEMLTDWLGLTTHAADENAAKVSAANAKIQKSSEERGTAMDKAFDHEIAMAKQAGKSTTYLELQKSMVAQREAQNRIRWNQREMLAKAYDTSKEGKEAYQKLKDSIKADNDLILAGTRQRQLITGQAAIDLAKGNEPKKGGGGGGGGGKSAAESAAKARLQALRDFNDFEISLIKDAGEREIAVTNAKYKRMLEDLVKDKEKTKAEKIKYSEIYLAQQKTELDNLAKERGVRAIDANLAEIRTRGEIQDIKIAMMKEGEAKELAETTSKYKKLRDAAKVNAAYDAEQKIEVNGLLNDMEAAENKKRTEDKIANDLKGQTDLLASLQKQDVIARASLDAKNLKDIEAANGHAETLFAIQTKYEDDIKELEKKAAIASIETKQKERDAKLGLANDIAKGIGDIGGMLIKDEVKLAKFNKASALVQIGIDTAKAISALVAQSQLNPLNGVSGGAAGIAQFAAGIIQIATNMAKAKQLLSTPSASVDGGGGGGTSTATSSVVPLDPSLYGSANTGNSFGAGGGNSSMTVTAVVSETEMTSTQNKINRINKSAEL